ncbi:MAG: GatB/YqeY domain-containing protein [Clostridia bacterium]|nr:GatB/YqeY domain-containing protein [Clostridia bacterium]
MSLKDRLLEDMKSAMKDRQTLRKNAISMTRAAILQVEKDKRVELDDQGVIEIIAKEVKQRRDSIPEFERGNRQDIVDDLKEEINVLMEYLPRQLSESEIMEMVDQTASEVGANSMKDMGKIMSKIMPKVRGRADGSIVSKLVKQYLQTL